MKAEAEAGWREAAVARSWRSAAAGGAAWIAGAGVFNKVVAFGSQFAIAYFLTPRDFGLMAIAGGLGGMVSVLAGHHLGSVLIEERNYSQARASEVFWLALLLNGAVGLLLTAAAWPAAALFGERTLTPLFLILGAAAPPSGLTVVYAAVLKRELRFGTMAVLQGLEGLVKGGLAVGLAAAGFGVYALAIPLVVSAVVMAGAHRWAVGRVRLGRPEASAWPGLLRKARWLMVGGLSAAAAGAGPALMVGFAQDARAAGLFAWGLAMAGQLMHLIAGNLQGVFFPVFGRVRAVPDDVGGGGGFDGGREDAFFQACTVLQAMSVAVCAGQVLAARWAVEWLFPERWWGAVPVVEWLSAGLVTMPVAVLGGSLLLAEGRYRAVALGNGVSAASALGGVAAGLTVGWDGIAPLAAMGLALGNCVPGFLAVRDRGRLVRVVGLSVAVLGLVVWGKRG